MNNKIYFHPTIAFILAFVILIGTFFINSYFVSNEKTAKISYDKKFNEIKEKKELEVNSETKTIFNNIGKTSNLVYALSLFHISPDKILEEVEKAIYIGKTPDGYYKIVTNENIGFSNYNEISLGLITNDIENFATLIKKLKKLYSDTFDFAGMQDFSIEKEKDENGIETGKVFYTTNLNLKYLKDDYAKNIENSQLQETGSGDETITNKYSNNQLAFDTLKGLISKLADDRKKNGKKEFYFLDDTEDNSIYLGTDIEYNSYNVYYITPENKISDILSLNNIGTKEDYSSLEAKNVKIILITKKDGTEYSMCTKIEKPEEELDVIQKQEKSLKNTIFTKIISTGTLDSTLNNFCELL